MPEEPLPRMRAHLIAGQTLLREILVDLRKDIQGVMRDLADDRKSLTRKGRNKHYKALDDLYMKKAVVDLAEYSEDLALVVATDTAEATLAASSIKGGKLLKVSDTWIKDVYANTFGASIKDHVALQTKKMLGSDIRALEQAVASTLREQAVTGFSAKDAVVSMQARVNAYADNPDTWAFLDKNGKKWDTGNYFAMLNRTMTTSFTDQAVRAQAIENKFDQDPDVLYVIETAGDPCPICSGFSGVIVSETGSDPRFPVTVSDAIASGWRHPNCVCSISAIDYDVDSDMIKKQGPIKKPPPNPTKEEWRDYRKDVLAKVPEETKFTGLTPALDKPSKVQTKRAEKEAADKRT